MKQIKQFFGVILIVALTLCGCGSGETAASLEGQTVTGGRRPGEQEGSIGSELGGAGEITGNQNGQSEFSYVQPEMKGDITVSCLYPEEFLSIAAEQFMEKYPDVKVTVNSYMDDAGSGTNVLPIEGYQTSLNTKIMTGKAEDIFFVSFLPVTKYSEMGVFEDLSGYVQAMPEMNDEYYFMNALCAAKRDSGALYVIPYRVRFDTIALSTALRQGHRDQWGSLKEMPDVHFSTVMDMAKQLVDETDKKNAFLTQMNAVSYADYLIKDSLSQFIDADNKEVHLDTSEYIELIRSVKALNDGGSFDSDIDFYNEEYYFAATCDFDMQAAFYSLGMDGDTTDCVPLRDAEGKVSLLSNACAALNSASENKGVAWEFLRYLMSDEIQSLPSLHGLSANRKGTEAAVERYYSFYNEGNGGTGYGSETMYRDLLISWIEQINACDMLDTAVMTLIEEENKRYFTGQQTAEDTAKRLQRQIEQYFNE